MCNTRNNGVVPLEVLSPEDLIFWLHHEYFQYYPPHHLKKIDSDFIFHKLKYSRILRFELNTMALAEFQNFTVAKRKYGKKMYKNVIRTTSTNPNNINISYNLSQFANGTITF